MYYGKYYFIIMNTVVIFDWVIVAPDKSSSFFHYSNSSSNFTNFMKQKKWNQFIIYYVVHCHLVFQHLSFNVTKLRYFSLISWYSTVLIFEISLLKLSSIFFTGKRYGNGMLLLSCKKVCCCVFCFFCFQWWRIENISLGKDLIKFTRLIQLLVSLSTCPVNFVSTMKYFTFCPPEYLFRMQRFFQLIVFVLETDPHHPINYIHREKHSSPIFKLST